MKTTYFLNFMGPISTNWYDKNNIPFCLSLKYNKVLNKIISTKEYKTQYCGGRIDVQDGRPFGSEIGVPIMEAESWNRFAKFLANTTTETPVYSLSTLVSMFESSENYKIKWL